MKTKLIALTMAMLIPMQTFASSCDWARDVKEQADGSFLYSRACHVQAGKNVTLLGLKDQRIVELEKTIELKDLALVKQKERSDLWMNSAIEQNEKLMKYDAAASKSNTLYFGLGIAAAALSVWAAGQLRR